MQILIVEGSEVVVHASIDVPTRKMESLLMEDGALLGAAFIGLSLLDSYIMEGMANGKERADGADRTKVSVAEWAESRIIAFSAPEKDSPFPGLLVVDDASDMKRVSEGRLMPALTAEQMATAMGMEPSLTHKEDSCHHCKNRWAVWLRVDDFGIIETASCNACLTQAFEQHMKEQADLDRLVEADQPPTGKGGCE